MTTAELTKACIRLLTLRGYHVWRANSGRAQYNVTLAPPGTPDIVGYSPIGRFIGVEIKVGRDELRPAQVEWLWDANKHGCNTAVVRELDDLVVAINTWERDS
jgi:hypothetical protein